MDDCNSPHFVTFMLNGYYCQMDLNKMLLNEVEYNNVHYCVNRNGKRLYMKIVLNLH